MYLNAPEELRALLDAPLEEIDTDTARPILSRFLAELERGNVRAAVKNDGNVWEPIPWVKRSILLGFRIGTLIDVSRGGMAFFDKDTFPLRSTRLEHGVRIVPGGSAIRAGAYVAPGVICMPPMYINVGAYVDTGTMIDSHALVGSCAQIGSHVHVSAAAQIGGVLEPPNALPVIIEDNVFVGGNCGVYEGCLVRRGAVLAPGVILTGSTPVFDLVNERILRRDDASRVLEIPEGAVVVPGSRRSQSDFGDNHGVSLYAPVIVKYRDERTDASTALESALR